jgi:hypothetical protein
MAFEPVALGLHGRNVPGLTRLADEIDLRDIVKGGFSDLHQFTLTTPATVFAPRFRHTRPPPLTFAIALAGAVILAGEYGPARNSGQRFGDRVRKMLP